MFSGKMKSLMNITQRSLQTDRLLPVVMVLMVMSVLGMVVVAFFSRGPFGRTEILLGYAAYALPAVLLVLSTWREQRFVTRGDRFMAVFALLVLSGLAYRLLFDWVLEAPRNLVYFVLFAILPYLCGRLMDGKVLALFEKLLLAALCVLCLFFFLPEAVGEFNGRPQFFRLEYPRISLGFGFGLGAIVVVGRTLAGDHSRSALLTGAFLLAAFTAVEALVFLRLSYYLLIAVVVVMLAVSRRVPSRARLALFVGLIAGVAIGTVLTKSYISYHAKLLHPKANQISQAELGADFFGKQSSEIIQEKGRERARQKAKVFRGSPWSASSPTSAGGSTSDGSETASKELSGNAGDKERDKDPDVAGRSVLGEGACLPIKTANDSMMIRVVLYAEALKMFTMSPFTGIGVSNFSSYSCLSPYGFPHSTILHVAAEVGLLGLASFLGAIVSASMVFIACYRRRGFVDWPLYAFGYFLLLDQFYESYFFSFQTYLFLGMAAALHRYMLTVPANAAEPCVAPAFSAEGK
jgi:hypothetical protein